MSQGKLPWCNGIVGEDFLTWAKLPSENQGQSFGTGEEITGELGTDKLTCELSSVPILLVISDCPWVSKDETIALRGGFWRTDSFITGLFRFFQVGDNQCLLQSLKDSPYYKGFEDKASLWETRLADLDEYLHNLNQIQRKWVYLEPIFGRGALPREQGRFKRVDDDFRFVSTCI